MITAGNGSNKSCERTFLKAEILVPPFIPLETQLFFVKSEGPVHFVYVYYLASSCGELVNSFEQETGNLNTGAPKLSF